MRPLPRPRATPARPARARERGQILPLVALAMVVVIGMAALAIDVGLNFVNQRHLQGIADMAALGGANQTVVNPFGIQQSTQNQVWRNLVGQQAPTIAFTTASGPGVPNGCNPAEAPTAVGTSDQSCTITQGAYTVTTIYPYTPQNPTVNPYANTSVVAVNISHVHSNSGFASFLGFKTTTIGVHAAAVSHPGAAQFPFAMATRFLDLLGSGIATAYGSVLIDQCSDSGAGNFSATGGNNGGFAYTNKASLQVGASLDSSGAYTTATAVLVADPSSPGSTCTSPNGTDASAPWASFTDQVNFQPSATNYNFAFGFNSGPGGCADPSTFTSYSAYETACQANPEGTSTAPWQDACWHNQNGNNPNPPLVPVDWTNSVYQNGAATASTVVSPCGTTATSSTPSQPPGTFEGSFPQSQFPGFPTYTDPETLAQTLGASIPTAAPPLNGYSFPAGVYVFSGTGDSMNIPNGGSLTCQSNDNPHFFPSNGCVFVFENGASFSMTGSSSNINCSYAIAGSAPCSFYFADHGTTTSTFSIASGVNGAMAPIPYLPLGCAAPSTTPPCPSYNFPVIYSNAASAVAPPLTSLTPGEVVSFNAPGTMTVAGTIYVPYGIYNSSANSSEQTGQVIADTYRLQSGSAAIPNGVSYDQSQVAPIQGPSRLIE